MKFTKVLFAALSAVLFAQATAAPVKEDKSPVQVQETDPTEVLSDLLNLMLDTLEKKKSNNKRKKNKGSGKIDVITGVTAHAKTNKNPYDLSPEEKDFVTQVLLESYNQVHLGDDYDGMQMDFVSDGLDEDEDVSATEDQSLRRRVPRPRSFRAWYRFSFNYSCRLCGDDAVVASAKDGVIDPQVYLQENKVHKEWENVFCSMLQGCPFEGLNDATDCVIDLDHGIDMTHAQA